MSLHRAKSARRGDRVIFGGTIFTKGRAAALQTITEGITKVQTFTTMYCGIEQDTLGDYTWTDSFTCPDCLREYGLEILGELP